ncbi:DUF2207 family protein [Gordonia bronchialis]|uniref:DUF2207 family protein n=1 Tax=Gordonia bronchialis TaxID=2054 RepID=UPI002432B39F|nr:DUF2207 domain-containing protein [Gordonia bronchialis]
MGAFTRNRSERIGRPVVLAFLIAAVLLIGQWLPFSLLVAPVAAFAVGGAGLWAAGSRTRRTQLGRDIWSRAGGFERLLSAPSNPGRLEFGTRKELYSDYLPYAVAFDCDDAWAQKYRAATAAEPPTPLWLVSVTGHDGSYGFLGGSGIDSFESSLSSSLSAYAASQSSSSSTGGGGFSGGGGGGGSW